MVDLAMVVLEEVRKIAAAVDNPFNLDKLTSGLLPYTEENDIGVNHGNSCVSTDFRVAPVEQWISTDPPKGVAKFA
jgi:hypothetical protein